MKTTTTSNDASPIHLACPECGRICRVLPPAVNAACPQCSRVFAVNTANVLPEYAQEELLQRAKLCASKGIDKREFVKSFERNQRFFAITAWFNAIEA